MRAKLRQILCYSTYHNFGIFCERLYFFSIFIEFWTFFKTIWEWYSPVYVPCSLPTSHYLVRSGLILCVKCTTKKQEIKNVADVHWNIIHEDSSHDEFSKENISYSFIVTNNYQIANHDVYIAF